MQVFAALSLGRGTEEVNFSKEQKNQVLSQRALFAGEKRHELNLVKGKVRAQGRLFPFLSLDRM